MLLVMISEKFNFGQAYGFLAKIALPVICDSQVKDNPLSAASEEAKIMSR